MPSPTLDVPAIRRDVEQAVRRSNEVWIIAVAARDPAPLAEVYTGRALMDNRADIERYRARNQTRTVRLRSLWVTDIQVHSADRAVVVTDEDWTDRLVEANGAVARDRNPWRISGTYELQRASGRWLVADVTIWER